MRKFEKVKRVENEDVRLPERSTRYSAGYDFYAIETVIIPPTIYADVFAKPILVKTGIKADMMESEYLMLCNRSSNPSKKGLILANGVGIVDKDYYGNSDNDGEIMFAFYNVSSEDVVIHKGDKIGQGIFMKYGITDDDNSMGIRDGGFGSTGE